jgi:WD40 repeat protein
MLDLAYDCFRFVTGYFEVINASAPHIYHTALVLAPQESTIQKLYEPYIHPLIRIIHGVTTSWDLHTAAATCPSKINLVAWSPCSRFVAISSGSFSLAATAIDVLDSVTFQQLQTLKLPRHVPECSRALIFSPNGHILTGFGAGFTGGITGDHFVVSWDLQTGGVTSVIKLQTPEASLMKCISITHSASGKVVGISYWCSDTKTANILTCDVASGACIHPHLLNSDIPLSNNVWTHGESLQFATAGATTITIWEVGFISGSTPTKVKTLPTLDNLYHTIFLPTPTPSYHHMEVQFLPASSVLILTFQRKVLVWDVQNSQCLLDYTDSGSDLVVSPSSNGCFFTCSTTGNICLWKESSAGYVPHKTLQLGALSSAPRLAPSKDGGSIVVFYGQTVQLLGTDSFTTPLSSIFTQAPKSPRNFLLVFSSDGTLAVSTMKNDSVVMILNLKSGALQLTINTGVDVCGLGVIGSTVVVLGFYGEVGKVIGWDLPTEGYFPGARMGLDDSSWTTTLKPRTAIPGRPQESHLDTTLISPNSCYIVLTVLSIQQDEDPLNDSYIYSGSTGEYLGHKLTDIEAEYRPWYAPDGTVEEGVWRVSSGRDVLEHLKCAVDLKYPWGITPGYLVTDDWWVLGPGRKRLLMLPPPWRSHVAQRVWKGQFLALLHAGLSEPVILELKI